MSDEDSCSSDDSDLAFASIDFNGVDFSEEGDNEKVDQVFEDKKKQAIDTKRTSVEKSEKHVEIKNKSQQQRTFQPLEGSSDKNSEINSVQTISLDGYEITFDKVCVQKYAMEAEESIAIGEEETVLLNECCASSTPQNEKIANNNDIARIQLLSKLLSQGKYAEVLCGESACDFINSTVQSDTKSISVAQEIRDLILSYCTNVQRCVEVEMIGVASLNLFLQINYTGPSLYHGGVERPGKEDQKSAELVESINPHQRFSSKLNVSVNEEREKEETKSKETNMQIEQEVDVPFQNSVLSELSVDGEWPCPVCKCPYFLLLARSILLALADPNRPDWSRCLISTSDNKIVLRKSTPNEVVYFPPPSELFVSNAQKLNCAQLWSARATVAHSRLIQSDEPSILLWEEVDFMFKHCKKQYCGTDAGIGEGPQELAAKICLEYGLAEHHFDRDQKGKKHFQQALSLSGLNVEVTGSEGKRTKYQQKSVAQMLVRAVPTSQSAKSEVSNEEVDEDHIVKQQVKHEEDTILLDRVTYTDEEDNVHYELSILQQTILLALCLDVKNDNPIDGLTGEQMGAYLERVLQQHDDWMVYATGLLERAWLESEGNHTRQRALLQIQALVDQHSNRLTLTQSTFEAAVENSAPPQERLKNLHYIVYPPRWEQLRDLAERYAMIGIVTSAAEIFEEIELWDEVVECYRRAGKEGKAEAVVRKRLKERETPKMWAALGDITKDHSYYEKALDLSGGKFSSAYVALGKHYSDEGDIVKAVEYFRSAVRVKPLSPHVWFRLGALSMRIEDWETALHAFTEVVQQEPEESDAWANVAAVHMQNRNPSEAYPALVEALKINRTNWRVWVSKLYTCMDLAKYDEAVQCCQVLIDLKGTRKESEGIPPLEKKIVQALVGESISQYTKAAKGDDNTAVESAQRTINRVRDLLTKAATHMKSESWIFEVRAYFNERIGNSEQAIEDLMKEYRALQNIQGWETDSVALPKLCRAVTIISEMLFAKGDAGSIKKHKLLLKGVIGKVKSAYFDPATLPQEFHELEDILARIETKLSKK